MTRGVVVTCGGGLQGSNIVAELAAAGDCRIHVIDNNPECIGKYQGHHFAVAPPVKDDTYLEFLEAYVKEHGVSAIVPATPYDLPLLARSRRRFEAIFACQVAVSSPALMEKLLDKVSTHTVLVELGLPVQERIDVRELGRALPVFGRPRCGWGGVGTRVVADEADLAGLTRPEEFLWTPYLEDFREFSVDFCISFDGRVSPIVVRERMATVGGFAVVMQSADGGTAGLVAPAIERLAEHLANEGGCGYFNVQFVRSARYPALAISDVNPRIGTSAVLARNQGLKLADHLFDRGTVQTVRLPSRVRIARSMTDTSFPLVGDRGVKGLVLDLDDTLISQRGWILEKAEYVARTFLPGSMKEWMAQVHRLIDEGRAGKLYDDLLGLFSIPAARDELIAAHRSYQPSRLDVYDDVLPGLERLGRHFRLFLLTDNPAASQKQKLRLFPDLDRFDAVVLTDEIGAAKPSPAAFLAICDRSGLAPKELAMVGDHFHRDIVGAQQAGYAVQFHLSRRDRVVNSVAYGEQEGMVVPVSNLLQVATCLEVD